MSADSGGGMADKILIVDDDIDSLKLIGLTLQRQGFEIVAANTGKQAIDKAASDAPDLIILDVMMPDMDGTEVCRRLRADPTLKGIPIVMFTAKAMVDDKVAGFEAGADDYLTKPTHPAELVNRVKMLLSRRQSNSSEHASAGLTLGFLGAKGGVGTTTLAANVAAALSQKTPTILTDFRPGQGSLGLSLGFGRSTGVANLLSRPLPELTQQAVESELVTHSGGLRLLLSSARAKEAQIALNPDALAMITKHVRSLARMVALDLGVGLSRSTVRLTKEIDRLVIAVEPYRVALNMTRDLLREFDSLGLGAARTDLVLVNRAPSTAQVPWQEAEQIIGHELLAIISSAPELAFQAAEAGQPLVWFQPTAVIATQIDKLAEELSKRGRLVTPGVAQ
ncbi:MAG: response regulator [Aggregatilineales bacterium]